MMSNNVTDFVESVLCVVCSEHEFWTAARHCH